MARKLRPDSTLGSLAPALRAEVDEMLLMGTSYAQVQSWLKDHGVELSKTSIAQYYQSQIVPIKLVRQRHVAADINKINCDNLDEATANAVRSVVFDLATSPTTDVKALNTLFNLVLKSRKLGLDDRKLRLLEEKAVQADKAKDVAKSALSAEEKADRIKSIFGL